MKVRRERRRIVIAGGTGFLGGELAKWFSGKKYEIVILSRRSPNGVSTVHWDGETMDIWADELEGAFALINLAGRSVDCRYNAKNRSIIMNSRVLSTRILGRAVSRCSLPPAVWINSSTATIYKHNYDQAHDESGEIGAASEAKDKFSVDVATSWEEEFGNHHSTRTRKIIIRTAVVLGNEKKSMFPMLRRLVRFGLGGKMGDGEQFVSWIHRVDFCRAIEWLIENEDASGTYNLCSPDPVRNQEMMAIFRRALNMPIGLPSSGWMLEIGAFLLRTETELVIKSRNVIPGRLLRAGFKFEHPLMEPAIEDLQKQAL